MLDILVRWNRWGRAKLYSGVERDIVSNILPFLESPEIIALIGLRRVGKTTILFQLMDALEKTGVKPEAMLHINLEEPALGPELNLELLDRIYATYRAEIFPKGKAYLFLDEIQNVPQWERWVRARNESENIKIFLTGSSSQLMSKELGTLLTGRHVSFKIFPLTFKEFLRFKGISLPHKILKTSPPPIIQNALKDYLKWGGFPEIALTKEEIKKELLLKQYFDDLLFKDVTMRHNIRDAVTLRNLAVHLLTHSGNLISFQRLSKLFGVSLDLIKSYCQYLQEAFLVDFISFYSKKVAERNRNPQKIYAIDLGLRQIVSFSNSTDIGHVFETAVYTHLSAQFHNEIFYWKNDGEIDFAIRKSNSIYYAIQVTHNNIKNPDIPEREIKALEEAKKLLSPKESYLIVNEMPKQVLYSMKGINVVPLWNFLLRTLKR